MAAEAAVSTLKGPQRSSRPDSARSVGVTIHSKTQAVRAWGVKGAQGSPRPGPRTREEKGPSPTSGKKAQCFKQTRLGAGALGYLATSTFNCPRTQPSNNRAARLPDQSAPASSVPSHQSALTPQGSFQSFRGRAFSLGFIRPIIFPFFCTKGDGSPGIKTISFGSAPFLGSEGSGAQVRSRLICGRWDAGNYFPWRRKTTAT